MIQPDMAAALQKIVQEAVTTPLPASLPKPEDTAAKAAADAPAAAPPPDTKGDNPPLHEGLTPISNPKLGFGLSGVNDWSVQVPFLDLMKSARRWVAYKPS